MRDDLRISTNVWSAGKGITLLSTVRSTGQRTLVCMDTIIVAKSFNLHKQPTKRGAVGLMWKGCIRPVIKFINQAVCSGALTALLKQKIHLLSLGKIGNLPRALGKKYGIGLITWRRLTSHASSMFMDKDKVPLSSPNEHLSSLLIYFWRFRLH